MKRSRDESQVGNNHNLVDEVPYPPLNLPLTKSQELINLIETHLKEHHSCPSPDQQTLPDFKEKSKMSTPPKGADKLKAMNFPINKITIGEWSRVSVYNGGDIVAKFYFAKKKLMWEFLDPETPETNKVRLKRKIEIQWGDVLSLKESINSRDETGILEIELGKRPTFFIETNPQPGKHTQWKQMEDFTQNQASICRRHTLHFDPGVLQSNLAKLVSGDSFWSQLYKVRFPVQKYMYFDDIRFLSDDNNSARYSHSHSHTLRFNVNDGLLHHHSPGTIPCTLRNTTHFWAWQTNPHGQANSQNYNTANELRGMQATPPLSHLINEHHNRRRYFTGSQYPSLPIQDESVNMPYGLPTLRRQAYGLPTLESQALPTPRSQAYGLPDSQPSLIMSPHKNEVSMYPQVGSYLANTLFQEGERQHKEQSSSISSNNWSTLIPDMHIEDDSNSSS